MEETLKIILPSIAGVILSFFMEWFPKFNAWYATLPQSKQKWVTIGLMAVVSGILFGMGCLGWLEGIIPGLGLQCTQQGAQEFIRIFFIVAFANQTTYLTMFKGNEAEILSDLQHSEEYQKSIVR